MNKTPVNFRKNRYKTVGGLAPTRYPPSIHIVIDNAKKMAKGYSRKKHLGGGGGGGGRRYFFFTQPPMEFNFLRHQPPMESESSVHQLLIEFNFPKAQWCIIPHLPTRIG